jgi:hypothetical protein
MVQLATKAYYEINDGLYYQSVLRHCGRNNDPGDQYQGNPGSVASPRQSSVISSKWKAH